jgi:hypothetical protein
MNEILKDEQTKALQALLAALEELTALTEDRSEIPRDQLEGLSLRLKSARVGFPLVMNEVVPQLIDRMGSVLLGPIFTSQLFPWPFDQSDRPMAPLCQINTAHLPIPIGEINGLIQVWLPQSEERLAAPLVRVIPATDADPKLMAPVIISDHSFDVLLPEAADWLGDFHSELKPSLNQYITQAAIRMGHSTADQLADEDWDEWCRLADEYTEKYGEDVVSCMQIVGFGVSRIYCDITPDHEKIFLKLEKLQNSFQKAGNARDDLISQAILKTCSAFKHFAKLCGDQEYPCFLGSFKEIQYRAADRDDPFLCFEAIGLREWGDGGNAQVFYSRERGFSFDWSCL